MTEIALGTDSEPLVNDLRLERIFYGLQKVADFPEDTQFATMIQEPGMKEKVRQAVFVVSSPHPRADKRALTPHRLITLTAMPYSRWREMEQQHRHYAGFTDPLRPVFAGVLRRHLKQLEGFKDMN